VNVSIRSEVSAQDYAVGSPICANRAATGERIAVAW
jgi:hypothetical protein